jgi:hypothetical protein
MVPEEADLSEHNACIRSIHLLGQIFSSERSDLSQVPHDPTLGKQSLVICRNLFEWLDERIPRPNPRYISIHSSKRLFVT